MELREKIAEEIARSHGCSLGHGYGQAHADRFRADADRILAIPEIAEALAKSVPFFVSDPGPAISATTQSLKQP